jgi:hypothetical protein
MAPHPHRVPVMAGHDRQSQGKPAVGGLPNPAAKAAAVGFGGVCGQQHSRGHGLI